MSFAQCWYPSDITLPQVFALGVENSFQMAQNFLKKHFIFKAYIKEQTKVIKTPVFFHGKISLPKYVTYMS